jgi:hypothetical protein
MQTDAPTAADELSTAPTTDRTPTSTATDLGETPAVDDAADATATTADAAVAPEPEPLSKDVLFELLRNQRRRDAIAFLKHEGGTTTLSDMAEHIAALENDTTVAQLTSSQRKRVYIGLYQCHLPKMATAGIVDFDKNRGTIELLESATQLDPFLEVGTPTDGRDSTAFLATAVGIGVGTTATLLGFPGFAAIPEAGWALVSATALVAFASVEHLRSRR